MKAKPKYIITINDPCHEKWSDMKPQAGGSFCGSCAKSVIDFSKLSDNQIIGILEKSNGGSICGRFEKAQLNKIMVQTNAEKSNPGLYKILAGLLLLASVETAVGQETTDPNLNPTTQNHARNNEVIGKIAVPPSISGFVTDEYGKPVKAVNVFSRRMNSSVETDKNGRFSTFAYASEKLIISKSGYDTQTIIISDKAIKIVLKKTKVVPKSESEKTRENNMIMGDIAYVEVPKKTNYMIDGVLNENFKIENIDPKRIKSVSTMKNGPSEVRSSRSDAETMLITTDLSNEEKKVLKIKSK